MISDIGTTLLQIALLVSIGQSFLWAVRSRTFYKDLLAALSYSSCIVILSAFALLIYAFVISDFSVLSVYKNSHSIKPLLYKITATWGHHEGSILLWCLVMALYGAAMTFARGMPTHVKAYSLHVMGLLQSCFLSYTIFTSNPFGRISPPPLEGTGLNPLLQDIGLAIHPPLLYLGYVGFAALFAYAIAAMATRSISKEMGALLHPWIMAPWAFLTLGIGLGSWWAYRELGWGGWWFWDPVENASFLPWLTATALFHSNIVMTKQGNFQRWVLLLALLTFILSLLGTFLVRSGILTSVHSFANDPTRGLYILVMIAALSGWALWIYYKYAPALAKNTNIIAVSRQSAVMVQNYLLVISMASILLAMLYPLCVEALGGRLLSIGAEYYSMTFRILMIPLLLICALSIYIPWNNKGSYKQRKSLLLSVLCAALGTAGVCLYYNYISILFVFGVFCGLWVMCSAVHLCQIMRKNKRSLKVISAMVLGHAGLGVFTLAVTLNGAFKVQYDYVMQEEDVRQAGEYALNVSSITYPQPDANYIRKQVTLDISHDDQIITLRPEERYYPVADQFTTEADIESFLTHDLYATIKRAPQSTTTKSSATEHERDAKATQESLVVQFHHNPMMSVLWIAILLIASGGLVATLQSRR